MATVDLRRDSIGSILRTMLSDPGEGTFGIKYELTEVLLDSLIDMGAYIRKDRDIGEYYHTPKGKKIDLEKDVLVLLDGNMTILPKTHEYLHRDIRGHINASDKPAEPNDKKGYDYPLQTDIQYCHELLDSRMFRSTKIRSSSYPLSSGM